MASLSVMQSMPAATTGALRLYPIVERENGRTVVRGVFAGGSVEASAADGDFTSLTYALDTDDATTESIIQTLLLSQ